MESLTLYTGGHFVRNLSGMFVAQPLPLAEGIHLIPCLSISRLLDFIRIYDG
jgi:hypothetical protein